MIRKVFLTLIKNITPHYQKNGTTYINKEALTYKHSTLINKLADYAITPHSVTHS